MAYYTELFHVYPYTEHQEVNTSNLLVTGLVQVLRFPITYVCLSV
jgi:hypothetical protein